MFQRDRDTITLTLADVGTVAGAALEKVQPKLAAKVQNAGTVTLDKRRIGSAAGDLARVARSVRLAAYVLAALTVMAAVAALAVSPDRRHTASRLGVGIACAGVAVVIAYTVARAIVLDRVADPDGRAAAGAVWTVFLGGLRSVGWLLAASGAVVAAAAASLIRPVAVEGRLRSVWRLATSEPRATWARVARAAALVALGALVIVAPGAALQVAATLVGVFIVYEGVEAFLRVIYRPPAPDAAPAPRRRALRLAIVPIIAILVVAGAAAAFFAGGGAGAPAQTIATCDGHAALCDRPLDEVVLPATHNAMSAPLKGWFAAEQERSIGGQLDDGIRGLLLDTHYGDKLADGRVRTVFETPADLSLAQLQDAVSPQTLAAAKRLRERLGFRGKGTRGMYLCHTFCEVGAAPLQTGLQDIHDFLVTHPSEVVVVINQDYVTPADFVKAVGAAGLTRYVFTGLDDAHWPTLREMIDADQRLVLLAENHAGAAPWYQLAYKRLTEETPYTFNGASLLTTPADLASSCRANRGPASAPLFLVNHWVSTDPTPRPSDATKVNAYAPLLARVRECERLRHHLPNLLAVNFYKRGDLFRVVDTLNGV